MADSLSQIVLVTDLSPSCDRAAVRATDLATLWGAKLHVLVVAEASLTPSGELADADAVALRAKAADSLKGHDVTISVAAASGDNAISARPDEFPADLIVTGPSDGRGFGDSALSRTAAALMKRSHAPVLVAKTAGDRAYRRVATAIDLSDASRAVIDVARRLFASSATVVVFHAFSTPFRMFSGDVAAYEAGIREGVTGEIRDALRAWSVPNASDIAVITEYGDPAARVAKLAERKDIDLVVTGTHGRTGLLSLLLGSVARDIVQSAGCDVMVVPTEAAH